MDLLADFVAVAGRTPDTTALVLDSDNSTVTTRTGRVARWVGNHRTSENRDVSHRFLDALRSTYGPGISENLVKQSGLGQLLESGKPLAARFVRETVAKADSMKIEVRRINAQVANMYAALPKSESGNSFLTTKIKEAANRLEPPNPGVVARVDMGAVSRAVEEAILKAGRNPDREIGLAEASRITKEIASRAVVDAGARAMVPDDTADATVLVSPVNPGVAEIQRQVEHRLNGSAYRSLPGGRLLTVEVGRHIDLGLAVIGWAQSDRRGEEQGSGGVQPDPPEDVRNTIASAAVRAAEQAVFLEGYGVPTIAGQHFGLLQKAFDQHSMVQDVRRQWDVKMNASALSPQIHEAFSDRLATSLSDTLTSPEQLPAVDAPFKERVAQAVFQAAEEMVGDFMEERCEQLSQLVKWSPEETFPLPLAQIFLHRAAPAEHSLHLLSLPEPELTYIATTAYEPPVGH